MISKISQRESEGNFRIIGIPIKIIGTQENPKISLGNKSKDLDETEYEANSEATNEEKDTEVIQEEDHNSDRSDDSNGNG